MASANIFLFCYLNTSRKKSHMSTIPVSCRQYKMLVKNLATGKHENKTNQ